MKSVVMLWFVCLTEAGDLHHVRTSRDAAYAASRIEQEGESFITITLPTFEKDLLSGIAQGKIGSNSFFGFRKRRGLPTFLSGFLRQLFDSDGVLRVDADPQVLKTLRQILLLAKKVSVPATDGRIKAALRSYISTDEQLEDIPGNLLAEFQEASRVLLAPYLSDVEARLWSGDWQPRHSSGALATRESYNSRFSNRVWTERLQQVFPWWEDLACSWREIYDHASDFSILARDKEPPCKVTFVPKTMKGPRIIAEEPAWIQYVQQGIFRVMSEVIQDPKHRKLLEMFAWNDQAPNRELARLGSIDGSYATLDLSEASDRVHLQLVEALLSSAPFLRECVLAARSESVIMPTGKVHRLKKFASMGSALCFPIESMVFFIIESMAWGDSQGIVPSALRMRGLPRMRVYGDDLIVPIEVAHLLAQRLESYGLKVNLAKSFTTGLFRESCGADWFRGEDVSVFKMGHPLPESIRQTEYLNKGIQFHNRVYDAGWFLVAREIEKALKRVLPRIPSVPVGMPVSALWSHDGATAVRHHPGLQRIQVKVLIFRQVKPVDPLDGYGAFKKVNQDYDPYRLKSRDHLERDGRGHYVGVHSGWSVVL